MRGPMRDPHACDSSDCDRCPGRTATGLILAEQSEVPPDCSRRVELSDPDYELARLLATREWRPTPRASSILTRNPLGGTDEEITSAISRGVLVLLNAPAPVPVGGAGAEEVEEEELAPAEVEEVLDWIEVRLVDEDDNPIAEETYRIVLPGGEVREDVFGPSGMVRIDDIVPGTCTVSFPRLGMSDM